MKNLILILVTISAFSFNSFAQDNPVIVLVKYKTQPQKSSEAISIMST